MKQVYNLGFASNVNFTHCLVSREGFEPVCSTYRCWLSGHNDQYQNCFKFFNFYSYHLVVTST